MPPLVSILTPSFNQAAWLRDNLRSVGNQTYGEIEQIVMDGGSTDETVAILEQAGPRVRWRSERDRGQSHALNKAFTESRGEIIGWMNSDDAYVDRRAVARAVEVFEREPEVGVVYGHGLLVSQSNRVMQFIWTPPYNESLLHRQTYFVQPSVFIRRSVIEEPFVNESLHYVMDRDLWVRLRAKTTFRRIPLVVGLDRNQPQRKSLMTDMIDEMCAYEARRGLDLRSRPEAVRRKVAKVALRWRGTAAAAALPQAIDPAIEFDFGSVRSRVVNQLFMPRAKMAQS
jgi:glycosyltransferase involved in cell wall biosynthesis